MTKAELEKVIEIIEAIKAGYFLTTDKLAILRSAEKAGLITGTCEDCKYSNIGECYTWEVTNSKDNDFYCRDWQGVE
jgi:hypothetical protein